MLELRLIGVHDDGENLVLESADGTRFLLPIDANLRTSITKARRIQPLRGRGTKGSFGPRDIQTRFRQGASVEEIAEESGWEPERVRRYEWPIVAERSHIIRAAQNVKVGRRDSASGIGQIPVTLAARIARLRTSTVLRMPPRIGKLGRKKTGSGESKPTLRSPMRHAQTCLRRCGSPLVGPTTRLIKGCTHQMRQHTS